MCLLFILIAAYSGKDPPETENTGTPQPSQSSPAATASSFSTAAIAPV